jgi:regulator of protease activity HflC (stomatin/prohibitin superfamily)
MEMFNSIFAFISKLLQWWFTVMPWEQAIRVRKGNIVKVLGAGLYLKIPFLDSVYIQTTRMRMIDIPMQTMSTKDGNTVTIKSAIGYTIYDIRLLYNSLFHPEMTLSSLVMGYIGEYVRGNIISDITPENISNTVNGKINQDSYGLKDVNVKITTFAIVKTFRLIQDGSSLYENTNMQPVK